MKLKLSAILREQSESHKATRGNKISELCLTPEFFSDNQSSSNGRLEAPATPGGLLPPLVLWGFRTLEI